MFIVLKNDTLYFTYNIPNSSSGSIQLRSAPLGFEYTGVYGYDTGSIVFVGEYGYYWSRTVNSVSHAYELSFGSSGVGLHNNSRGTGFAVRCGGG